MAKKTSIGMVVVQEGQKPTWKLNNKELFFNDLAYFGDGTKIKITIEHYYPQRSLKQNGVLHWYCTELAEEAAMEMEEFKKRMADKFLRRELRDKNGEYVCDPETGEIEMYTPSTADLDTAEMTIYIEKIRMFGLNFLNYELPLPDANHKIKFLEDHKQNLILNNK